MLRFPALAALLILPGCVGANVDTSPRPEARPPTLPDSATASRLAPGSAAEFPLWLQGFEDRARHAGIAPATLARARPHLRYLPESIALDRRQSEFGARVWDYMDGAVTAARIAGGRTALQRHAALLRQIEQRFGVPPEVIVAIWGIESSYGANRGRVSTLATLATLAKDGRRGAFFEQELLAALQIVAAGDISPEGMVGSWAGAFGHMQFMPSSYLGYAVDFTGNGRRDLWSDDPADALASAAHYLARRGWQRGQPWAVEVHLPEGLDPGLTGQRRSTDAWTRDGLRPVRAGALPQGTARLILPGGLRGPAFLAFPNYDVLKEYNISDAYVLAVGHLSDRLAGLGPLQGAWPRGDRPLTLAERTDLQRRLTALGHDTAGIDGRIGPATVAAVQAWQRSKGLPADGYVNAELLERLRRGN